MPRYYKKRVFKAPKDKYSVEHTMIAVQGTPGTTTAQVIVPAVNLQGMRKVKHLTINACPSADFIWAIVYVPQGMTYPGLDFTSGASLCEPNQFIRASGVASDGAGPQRISTRISRNLNSGDAIVLLVRPTGSTTATFAGVCSYAITLQ